MWMQQGGSLKFGDVPRVFATIGGLRSAVNAYTNANLWRRQMEELSKEDIQNELEVCKIELRVLAAIPGGELVSVLGI